MHTVNLEITLATRRTAPHRTDMVDTYVPPPYPLLRFTAAHGMKLAGGVAAVALLAGLAGAMALNSWIAGAAAVFASAVLWGMLASYVEMVRVVVDMLVPR